MHHRASLAGVACLFSLTTLLAQAPATLSLDTVLDRMGEYLRTYESQLTAITADEKYEQREVLLKEERVMASRVETPVPGPYRRLESEVAFVRLPGSDEWAGLRDVHHVDGNRVKERSTPLAELLTRGSDTFSQASAMTAASSRYNLGTRRTINMPTVPLDLLHPKHRERFTYQLKGSDSVRGVKTLRLTFQEIGSPTVIRRSSGDGDVRSNGTVWVEHHTGSVRRVEVFLNDPLADSKLPWSEARIRVEFSRDRRLDVMVPVEMTEIFDVFGGRGEGKATYTNFKRFETGARIVP